MPLGPQAPSRLPFPWTLCLFFQAPVLGDHGAFSRPECLSGNLHTLPLYLTLFALRSLPPCSPHFFLSEENAHLWGAYCMLGNLQTVSSLNYTFFLPHSFLPSLLSDPRLPPGGGHGHILSIDCVPCSLHIFPPFLTPSPSPSPLSVLCLLLISLGCLLSSKAENTHLLSTYGMPNSCLRFLCCPRTLLH